jgi:DNA invertase Pin-like site-specific DNA recombinase
MIYAYLRVSSKLQYLDTQKFEILNYSFNKKLQIDEIIEETADSKKPYKERLLGSLIEKLKKDDILLVTELSRFGRSAMEVMDILNIIIQKEVKLFIIKNNIEFTDTIQSKIVAFAFGLSSEIERNLISSRTKEALAKLKADGVHIGRPIGKLSKSKLDGKEKQIDLWLAKKISIA